MTYTAPTFAPLLDNQQFLLISHRPDLAKGAQHSMTEVLANASKNAPAPLSYPESEAEEAA